MTKRFLSALLLLVTISCSNSDEDPCVFNRLSIAPQGIHIDLRDDNNVSLIGSAYTQDSFKFYNSDNTQQLVPIDQGDHKSLFIDFYTINSGQDYYLELTEQDTDTLKISFSIINGTCFDRLDLDQFIYNDQVYYDGEKVELGYYIIEKEQ